MEHLMTELFFKLGPNSNGQLSAEQVSRLSRMLATACDADRPRSRPVPANRTGVFVISEDQPIQQGIFELTKEEAGPPPEPLPLVSMRFPAFRSSVHRTMASLTDGGEGSDSRERVIRQILAQLDREASIPHDTADSGAVSRSTEVSAATKTRAQHEPILDSTGVQETCWMPDVLPAEGVRTYLKAIGDAGANKLGQESLEAVTSKAFESSKQVLNVAREYGKSLPTLLDSESFAEQRLKGQAVAQVLLDYIRPVCDDQAGKLGRAPERQRWTFDAGDGLHIDTRDTPDIGGARNGGWVRPGEVFEVAETRRGKDGVLFLRLADGRGWLFESKPGVGTMCTRA